MGLDVRRGLALHTWKAFDVDDEGRVLAGSDETGSVQLVELAPDGASTPLTALRGGCSGSYLSGERAVVVEHAEGGNERGQLSLLRLGSEGYEPLAHDPRHVHRLMAALPGRVVYLTNRRNGVDFDVVIRNVFSGEEETVYDQGGMTSAATASPDSRYVAVVVPTDLPMSSRLVLVDTMPETEAEHVVALTGAQEHAVHSHPHWLADSSGLVVTTNRGRDLTGIARYDLATEQWSWLVASEQHDLTGWLSPDGRTLLVLTNADGAAWLTLHDSTTGEQLREVPLPAAGWVAYPLPEPVWSPNSRFLALSFSSPATPGDVLLVDVESGSVKALTDSRAQFDQQVPAEPTLHRVADRIPCFRYGDGESAVLFLHGGPEGQSVQRFDPLVQGLVAAGHTVLVPNIRGSVGYGKRYYSADDVDKRLESIEDLITLHDWLTEQGTPADRIALWGRSYGGYLVLAGLAFQPDRWAAGVDIVGISSLVTFLRNTSGYRRAAREREYGSLERDLEFLERASPLNSVDAIRAPLFVVHGANDPRVPVAEAEQLAEAVRRNGIECELRVYADEGHQLANEDNKLDAYPAAIEFLDRVLRG
ncbi:S9 family peptidase [Kutzneria viridogrisea]|uniref:Dipeptidyl aminopeptidase/acylaminoacyl peptidase n=1 Tax=Kutzneria viridogrisea TaxID=47990 RepID=A0ABR6BQV6_9PSEU|nr:dipeptidyl aminopeptidase/acylaminoacyl peptidase [Kutzneria viridogrisea]